MSNRKVEIKNAIGACAIPYIMYILSFIINFFVQIICLTPLGYINQIYFAFVFVL